MVTIGGRILFSFASNLRLIILSIYQKHSIWRALVEHFLLTFIQTYNPIIMVLQLFCIINLGIVNSDYIYIYIVHLMLECLKFCKRKGLEEKTYIN